MKWHELEPKAQRNALIFAAIVSAALLVLIWPAGGSFQRSPARREGPKSAAGKPGPVVHAAAPQTVPPPPADPTAALLGKWEGRESLPNRGLCSLTLEVRPGEERQGFAAFSTLACMGNFLPGSNYSKDPTGMADMVRRSTNPTSASFSGRADNGGIVMRALDNIGVSEALQGCDMASMTLKAFGVNRMSVKWQETGKGSCEGGEMLLGHARQ